MGGYADWTQWGLTPQPAFGQFSQQFGGFNGGLPPISSLPMDTNSPLSVGGSDIYSPLSTGLNLDTLEFAGGLPTGGGGVDPFSMQGIFGGKDANGNSNLGWGTALLDLGKAGFGGYMANQQLKLAKDNLNFQKESFSKQFENQRSLANTEMQDRQNARVASNPNAYQSTDEYMKAHRV